MYEEVVGALPELAPQQPPRKKAKQEGPPKKAMKPRWIPKCLVVLSHYAYFHVYRTFLKQLHRIFISGVSPLPLERYIANFVQDVPLPTLQTRVEWNAFTTGGYTIILEQPAPNQLPLVNFSYQPLFRMLSIPNVLVLWGILLQEGRVVLCSRYHSLLTPVAQALLTLLFPLEWHGMYIPVLPSDMIDVLDAPVPYLVGMDRRYIDDDSSRRPEGVVFCDLDHDVLHLGWGDDWQARRLPDLPDQDVLSLKVELEELVDHLYLVPSSGIKGRITSGNEETMDNSMREPYSQMTRLHNGTSKCHRETLLSNAERAFVDNVETLRQEDFASEQVCLIRQLSSPTRTTTPVMTPSNTLFSSLKRQTRTVQAHTDRLLAFAGKEYATPNPFVEDIPPQELDKIAGQLYELDEDNGHAVRLTFLRFFTLFFLQYKKYIKTDREGQVYFHKSSFLSSLILSTRNQHYVSDVIGTQMFERFVQESPNDPRVQFFDEHIVLVKNTSLWHSGSAKQQTPFLDSSKFKVNQVIYPPAPTGGINGKVYRYTHFPKLYEDEFVHTQNSTTTTNDWCSVSYLCGAWPI